MDFVQCSYVGQVTADGRRFDGLGRYTFANGDVYLGGMQDGQFHGHGVIFFRSPAATGAAAPPPTAAGEAPADDLQAFMRQAAPASSLDDAQEQAAPLANSGEWSGQYRGVWEHGRHLEGRYVFQDGLVYGSEEEGGRRGSASLFSSMWTYCHGSDHRLWEEYLENVAPVLPHEALLGGAKLLHTRKAAIREAGEEAGEGTGEGLPIVLPNAFVQARAAPAFAKGQLTGMTDARVVRWTDAAIHAGSDTRTYAAPSPEMVQSTVALQLAMSLPTEGLRADGRLDDDEDGAVAAKSAGAPVAVQPKMNLAVCRVRDVEDVNRALVQIAPAPSPAR